MRNVSLGFRCTVAASLLAVVALGVTVQQTDADDDGRKFARIDSTPGGQTYGRWAAEWWQWALGVPDDTNPVEDPTGEFCAERQIDDTWFLAGSFDSGEVIHRNCTVPAGKALFFPLVSRFYGAFLDDPEEQRTEEFVRGVATCTYPAKLRVEIDGEEIPEKELLKLTTGKSGSQSPLFNVQLPPGSIFVDDFKELGLEIEDVVRELVFSPSAEEGFYLYLSPLGPGKHLLRWEASCTLKDQSTNTQDVTYYLTVEADDDDDDDGDYYDDDDDDDDDD